MAAPVDLDALRVGFPRSKPAPAGSDVPYLTRAERHGAWLLAAILMLGTFWDLIDARFGGSHRFRHGDVDRSSVQPDSGLVDLNRATAVELRSLPGIGPVLAGRIVAHREAHGPFRRTEELLAVRGVGPRLYDRVRDRLRVSAQP